MPQSAAATSPAVQIIVPARNEEASLGRCLESLTTQTGIDFQITVVDDGSTDRTREIAESFAGVRVIRATEPPPGISGKCNALIQGAEGATAKWLLFTDADTWHRQGSLAGLVGKAEVFGADLFSVSPVQETGSWSEKLIQPLVFGDLAWKYRQSRVNDPKDPTVAANGQYLLVRRDIYERLGGHKAVADKILEDVEIARKFKESGYIIWFDTTEAIRTRMYRGFHSLLEGWTKNLALLFRRPLRLALFEMIIFVWLLSPLVIALISQKRDAFSILQGIFYSAANWFIYGMRGFGRFPLRTNAIAPLGLPLYSWLLVRSWLRWRKGGNVTWKGRTYPIPVTGTDAGSSIKKDSQPEGPHLHGLLDEKG